MTRNLIGLNIDMNNNSVLLNKRFKEKEVHKYRNIKMNYYIKYIYIYIYIYRYNNQNKIFHSQ
jgi:hypothetical protein